MHSIRRTSTLVVLVWAGALVLAVSVAGAEEPPLDSIAVRAMDAEANSDVTPGATMQPDGVGWNLVSLEKSSRVIARIDWTAPGERSTFRFEASGPAGSGDDDVDLLNIDGLVGNGTEATASYTVKRPFWKKKSARPTWLTTMCGAVDESIQRLRRRRTDSGSGAAELPTPFANRARGDCNAREIDRTIAQIDDYRERSRLRARALRENPVWVGYVSLIAGAAQERFTSIDPADLAGQPTYDDINDSLSRGYETSTRWGAEVSAQLKRHFVSVGYQNRSQWKAVPQEEICAPVEVMGTVTRCVMASVGMPVEIDKDIVTGEWRTSPSDKLGVRVRAMFIDEDVRDGVLLDDEWELQATLYFFRKHTEKKNKGLNGGVTIARDTAFDDTTARIFVGQVFDLFD